MVNDIPRKPQQLASGETITIRNIKTGEIRVVPRIQAGTPAPMPTKAAQEFQAPVDRSSLQSEKIATDIMQKKIDRSEAIEAAKRQAVAATIAKQREAQRNIIAQQQRQVQVKTMQEGLINRPPQKVLEQVSRPGFQRLINLGRNEVIVKPMTDRERLTLAAEETKKREQRLGQTFRNIETAFNLKRDESKSQFRPTEILKTIGRTGLEFTGIPITILGRAELARRGLSSSETRGETLKILGSNIKDVPKAIVQGYDPRTVEGLLNIAVATIGVKKLATVRQAKLALTKQTPIAGEQFSTPTTDTIKIYTPEIVKKGGQTQIRGVKLSDVKVTEGSTPTVLVGRGQLKNTKTNVVQVGNKQYTTVSGTAAGKKFTAVSETDVITGLTKTRVLQGNKVLSEFSQKIKPELQTTPQRTIFSQGTTIDAPDLNIKAEQFISGREIISARTKGRSGTVSSQTAIRQTSRTITKASETIIGRPTLDLETNTLMPSLYQKGEIPIIYKAGTKVTREPTLFTVTKADTTIEYPGVSLFSTTQKQRQRFFIDTTKAIKQKVLSKTSTLSQKQLSPIEQRIISLSGRGTGNLQLDTLLQVKKRKTSQPKPISTLQTQKIITKTVRPAIPSTTRGLSVYTPTSIGLGYSIPPPINVMTGREESQKPVNEFRSGFNIRSDFNMKSDFNFISSTGQRPMQTQIGRQQVTTKEKAELQNKEKIRENQKPGRDIVDITRIGTTPEFKTTLTPKISTLISQGTRQDLTQKQLTKQTGKTITPQKTNQIPIQTPTLKFKLRTFLLPVPTKNKPRIPVTVTQKDKGEGWAAFIKRSEKSNIYDRVNKIPLTKKAAQGLGYLIADKFVNRSGYIKKVSGKPKQNKKYESAANTLSFKFRASKKNPNIFVEKNKYAIDSRNELQGITFKGIKAPRRKRKKK